MADPSIYGGHGALSFPLVLPSTGSRLDALDPGRAAIAGLLKAAINAELGDAWKQRCNQLEAGHYLVRVPGQLPAADVVEFEPSPALLGQRSSTWPLLAVYREGEPKTEGYSLYETRTTQQWAVDWVIGPLDAGYQTLIGSFALAVAGVVRRVIQEGWHPAYQNGTRQFYGQFVRIDVIGQQGPGFARVLGDEKGNGYYGISLLLQTIERTVRTVGHVTDVANRFYPAYANAPAGTTLSTILLEDVRDNETPDPE